MEGKRPFALFMSFNPTPPQLSNSQFNTQYDYDTTKITEELKEKIARAKLRGAKPRVPPEIRNSTDPNIKAVLTAMNRCYRNDPGLRPSSREIADYLQSQLDALESSELDKVP